MVKKYGSWFNSEVGIGEMLTATDRPGDVGDVAVVHEFEEIAIVRKKGQGKISEVW